MPAVYQSLYVILDCVPALTGHLYRFGDCHPPTLSCKLEDLGR